MARTLPLLLVVGVVAGCASGPRVEPSPQPDIVADSTRRAGVAQPGTAAPGTVASRADSLSAADLDRRTAELFGDALKVDVTIPVPADTPSVVSDEEPSWDIEVRSYETVDRVRYYVASFSGDARGRFVERLRRGTRYEAMIREKLRAGSLPEDMYFLALVESGFNPNAYSSAAAVGMWQFMTSTARGMGLRVDWWIDERRDPVRSTKAAVGFLRGLREQFGSMYLAAAAYNGGPGRVARGLSRYADDLSGALGDDAFFALAEKNYLRSETRDYVPQLVASALVAKEPARYGIAFDSLAPFAYDSARLGPRVALTAVATAAGTSIATIQELNPHILRGMTAPTDSMWVRIPHGGREHFDSAFAGLAADDKVGARLVTTGKSSTWSSFIRKGVSARSVSTYNPTIKASRKSGLLTPGVSVLVPTVAALSAALPVPDPSIERYGGGNRTHVVRRGESLSLIAQRYHTTVASIMRINRLKKALIFPGQELLVKAQPRPARAKAAATSPRAIRGPAPQPKR